MYSMVCIWGGSSHDSGYSCRAAIACEQASSNASSSDLIYIYEDWPEGAQPMAPTPLANPTSDPP